MLAPLSDLVAECGTTKTQKKAGKKKMRQFGKVDIPQEAFISALKMDG